MSITYCPNMHMVLSKHLFHNGVMGDGHQDRRYCG
jgi:hypothetical protein